MSASSGKISLALGGGKKPPPTNGIKRSHAALRDEEDVSEEHGRSQTVSHFDQSAGGAIDVSRPKKEAAPLVIAPQANRDWKEASQRSKRQRNSKFNEAQAEQRNGVGDETKELEGATPIYGLNVRKRAADDDSATNGHSTVDRAEQAEKTPREPNGEVTVKKKTEDDEAIDALLGNAVKSSLVLPAVTEQEAFDQDYKVAPDMATLEDYARVPVEQFGAALLRGMGWKDGEGIGNNRGKKVEKTKLPERRPALLGIGAKEEAAVAQELGTWGRAAKDRKGPQQIYNPILLRDKKTGELFTEEELEKKKEREKREQYEMEFEREQTRKEKERRYRDRDDSRDRGSDRRGKERERKREHESGDGQRDDSDEEYYRRKKERRRREREGSDYDRQRSRQHDSRKDHERDRRR